MEHSLLHINSWWCHMSITWEEVCISCNVSTVLSVQVPALHWYQISWDRTFAAGLYFKVHTKTMWINCSISATHSHHLLWRLVLMVHFLLSFLLVVRLLYVLTKYLSICRLPPPPSRSLVSFTLLLFSKYHALYHCVRSLNLKTLCLDGMIWTQSPLSLSPQKKWDTQHYGGMKKIERWLG